MWDSNIFFHSLTAFKRRTWLHQVQGRGRGDAGPRSGSTLFLDSKKQLKKEGMRMQFWRIWCHLTCLFRNCRDFCSGHRAGQQRTNRPGVGNQLGKLASPRTVVKDEQKLVPNSSLHASGTWNNLALFKGSLSWGLIHLSYEVCSNLFGEGSE